MCGIVGFVGKSQAAPILLDGLSKRERQKIMDQSVLRNWENF